MKPEGNSEGVLPLAIAVDYCRVGYEHTIKFQLDYRSRFANSRYQNRLI